MLVAFTIMASVIAMVFLTLSRSQGQTNEVTKVAEERQMARTAVQLLERETRMAGSGWGRTTVYTGAGAHVAALNPGFGGSLRSDSLMLVGAWQAATTTTSPMVDENSTLRVANVSGFVANDFLVITDTANQFAHLFQVTDVDAATGTLSHSNASTYNTGHTNWPASGFGNGSFVYKITMSTYAYDSTTFRRPVLVRRENNGPPQVVAYNIDGFHVWYDLQDGTQTRNPLDLSMVDKIVPVVLTRVTNRRSGTLRDSVWASVRPRTF
jgi:hypothetical protein